MFNVVITDIKIYAKHITMMENANLSTFYHGVSLALFCPWQKSRRVPITQRETRYTIIEMNYNSHLYNSPLFGKCCFRHPPTFHGLRADPLT